MWRKETLVYCGWEFKLVQPLWKTVCRSPQKLKIELPYDTGTPRLAIYPKKSKTLVGKDICTPRFTAALVTTTKL